MKLLFIGNSYTYYNDLPALVSALARENGHPAEVASVTKGGWRLYQYLDVRNEYADALDARLAEGGFDAVFLQEQSLLPIVDFEAFRDGAVRIGERLKGRADRVILYATWGRKEGSPTLEEHGWTRKGMTDALFDAYTKVAAETGFEVSPVGPAFYALNEAHPEIDLHHTDLTHPSPVGSRLAAIVHYKTLFGTLPEKTDSLGLPAETVAALLAVAR